MKLDMSEQSLPVFEALASKVRLHIIRLLALKPMNVKELAAAVDLSSAIMTMHIKKLEKAGLIYTELLAGKGGLQKLCHLSTEKLEIVFPPEKETKRQCHRIDIAIGHYTDFQIEPTCGLATTEHMIGEFDDPRYFLDPQRLDAKILWFGQGYIEYKMPNFLLASQQPEELVITMEICSEAPLTNSDWPSDITFILNGVTLGSWTSPGDYGDRRGAYTPAWWPSSINQYGLYKQLRITTDGTYMDGVLISGTTIADVSINQKQWTFRIAVCEDARHVGGVTLFGKGFGNYNDDIVVELYYTDTMQTVR